ncbi:MAG: DUF4179 domain-containing protein [Dehalococcoidia bacterium]|jgi:hypothetical protein
MPKTRLAWALFLPLIVILLGGAVYGAGSLVSELFQKHAPQIEEAGLALPLDLSQTIDGVTVSLERAYVDANVALVGFTVSGPDEKYQPFFGKLSTADGQNLPGMIGMGVVPGSKAILGNWQSSERAAVIVSFDASSLKGTPSELSLILEVNNVADSPIIGESQIPAGPFRFEFNVPFHGGETVRIDQTVEAAGVPVTLEQVTISPWGVRAVLQTPDSKKYLPITSITLPSGDSVNGALSTHTEASIVKYFMGDFTGQTGEWTFTVKELVLTPESPTAGTHPASDTRRLAGPWVFRFDVP